MEVSQWVTWLLVAGAIGVVISTYPYLATAIAYRQRDNGLAYIVLIMGVGFWNGMFAAQILTSEPLVESFFLSLSIVGSVLAGLGWLLFASTASSTPAIPRRRLVFGSAAYLVGIDIVLTITSPTHFFYWTVPSDPGSTWMFAVVTPNTGYWLHTQLLVLLFGAGALLFAIAWSDGIDTRYTKAYTIAGTATAAMIAGSNILLPGGVSLAPLVAALLTTIGWIQAQQKLPSSVLQSCRRIGRSIR